MTVAHDPWVHTFEMTLPGDPARVFAALTTPEPLTRWFADHVQVELREGGAFRFWGRHSYGTPSGAAATQRVTRLEPPTVLAFSWQFEGVPSEVTLTATPAEP